jgi:hypothetical protein
VIERQPAAHTSTQTIRWQLRYSVVTDVLPDSNGRVAFNVVEHPLRDPLGITQLVDHDFLHGWHDEREWLETQALSQYPDSVVTLSRHMLWQENIQPQEQDAAPDLVITARPGWYFGSNSSPGTTHGYPLADSMRACWFVSGPNVRRGARIESPCRLADLTPTLLDMVGSGVNMDQFDGRPIRSMYHTQQVTTLAPVLSRQILQSSLASESTMPPEVKLLSSNGDLTLTSGQVMKAVYWDAVDLQAWQPVTYQPVPDYPFQPLTINHPGSPYDLHNVAYNTLLFTELSLFRIMDDVISPLTRGRSPFTTATDRVDLTLRHHRSEWVSESSNVIDLTNATIWDYRLTSQNSPHHVDSAVGGNQRQGQVFRDQLADVLDQPSVPGLGLLSRSIDTTRYAIWGLYGFGQRNLIQLVDETLIQSLENTTDRVINAVKPMPAEVRVPRSAALQQ